MGRVTRKLVSTVVLACTALFGAANAGTVTLTNWTPRQFPWDRLQQPPRSLWLYAETFWDVQVSSFDHRQKALLEVRPDPDVRLIDVAVVDKAGPHQMREHVRSGQQPNERGLFEYALPPSCSPSYHYYFVVRYETLLGKSKVTRVKTLQNAGNRWFGAQVLGAGRYIWWPWDRVLPATTDGEATIAFHALADGSGPPGVNITFQNRIGVPMRISYWMENPETSDSSKFKVSRLLPERLEVSDCGGTMSFELRWSPTDGDFNDRTRVVFIVESLWQGQWIEFGRNVLNVFTLPFEPPA